MKYTLSLLALLCGMCLTAADFSADVTPFTRMRVSFSASGNPQWQIRLTDPTGNIPMGGLLSASGENYLSPEGAGRFVQEFYVPDGVCRVTLRTDSAVNDVVFAPAPASDYVNINPEFKLGAGNVSGYRRMTRAAIRKDEAGNLFLEVQPSRYAMVLTDPIPVKPGTKYHVTLRRYGPGVKNINIILRFLDRYGLYCLNESNYWQQGFTFYSSWKNTFPASKTFVAPENAVTLECLVSEGNFAGIYIKEVK